MAVLYLVLEPYLLYSFRGRPLVSEEGIAEIAGRGEVEAEPGAPFPAGASLTNPALTERQRSLIAGSFDRLSARELAVAEMLMQGFRYEDLCKRLNIKKSTAYWYRNQLFDKLQIRSLRELFALAEKHPK
jgi:DNA-binding CsgD family transcriptional regulator